MSVILSGGLGIASGDIPLTELFEKNIKNQELTADEQKQLLWFGLALTTLQDYASADDKVAVDYVGNFYSYLCTQYGNYSSLPEGAKQALQVAYFSSSDSFMGTAYETSNCSAHFFDTEL